MKKFDKLSTFSAGGSNRKRSVSLRRLAEFALADHNERLVLIEQIYKESICDGFASWQNKVVKDYLSWVDAGKRPERVQLYNSYEREAYKLMCHGDMLRGKQRVKSWRTNWDFNGITVRYSPRVVYIIDGKHVAISFWMYADKSPAGAVGQLMANWQGMACDERHPGGFGIIVDVFSGTFYLTETNKEQSKLLLIQTVNLLFKYWEDYEKQLIA